MRGGGEGKPQKRVYLLSDGLSNPQMGHRRCKSGTFKFPLPPSKGSMAPRKGPLKSALRQGVAKGDSSVLRAASAGWGRSVGKHLSPQPEEESDEQARQGWSPYSSVVPTPRQGSSSHRTDLLSPTNEEHLASPGVPPLRARLKPSSPITPIPTLVQRQTLPSQLMQRSLLVSPLAFSFLTVLRSYHSRFLTCTTTIQRRVWTRLGAVWKSRWPIFAAWDIATVRRMEGRVERPLLTM